MGRIQVNGGRLKTRSGQGNCRFVAAYFRLSHYLIVKDLTPWRGTRPIFVWREANCLCGRICRSGIKKTNGSAERGTLPFVNLGRDKYRPHQDTRLIGRWFVPNLLLGRNLHEQDGLRSELLRESVATRRRQASC